MQLQKIVGVPIAQIRLLGPDRKRVMEDEALLSDHNIGDNDALYLVLQVGGSPIESVPTVTQFFRRSLRLPCPQKVDGERLWSHSGEHLW
jgi:hypothetical protein